MSEGIVLRVGKLLPAVAVSVVAFLFLQVHAFALEPAGEIHLPEGLDELRASVRSVDGQHGYFATSSVPAEIVKVDLETFEFIDSITLEPGESGLRSGFISPDGEYAYFGTATSPGRVIRVSLETFERKDALELEDGMDSLRAGFVDHQGQYGYFGTYTTPGQLVRIDLEAFEPAGAIEMDIDSNERNITRSVIDPEGEFAYLTTSRGVEVGTVPPAHVIKIELEAFERVDAITLGPGEHWLSSVHMDPAGEYIWAVNSMSTGRVARIGLDPFERIDTLVLPSEDERIQSGVIDASGNFAYLGTRTDPPRVVKVDLASFERLRAVELPDAPGQLNTVEIGSDDRFLFFGTASEPGAVVRLDNSRPELHLSPQPIDFGQSVIGYLSATRVITLTNTGLAPSQDIEIELDGDDFVLIGNQCPTDLQAGESCDLELVFAPTQPGDVEGLLSAGDSAETSTTLGLQGTGIDDAAFQVEDSVQDDTGALGAPLMHPDGHSLYFSTHIPGPSGAVGSRMIRVGTDPLSFQESLDLPEGELFRFASVVDSSGNFAYQATDQSIVKIDLETFAEVGSLPVEEGFRLLSAVMDCEDRYAYFGAGGEEPAILKIDLDTLAVSDTLEFDQGDQWIDFYSAGMDPSGQYAYFSYLEFGETGGVARVDLEEFDWAGENELPAEFLSGSALMIDSLEGYLYMAGGATDIARFDLETFQPAGTLAMVEDELVVGGVIDPEQQNAFLLAMSPDWGAARALRVELERFERIDRIHLADSTPGMTAMVIDPDYRFAYAGLDSTVVQIRLRAPELAFDPPTLSFAKPDGDSHSLLTATLSNQGEEALTGLKLAIHDGTFDIASTTCGSVLEGGDSCQVDVAFDPGNEGVHLGAVHVNTDQLVPARLDLVAGIIDSIFDDRFSAD